MYNAVGQIYSFVPGDTYFSDEMLDCKQESSGKAIRNQTFLRSMESGGKSDGLGWG